MQKTCQFNRAMEFSHDSFSALQKYQVAVPGFFSTKKIPPKKYLLSKFTQQSLHQKMGYQFERIIRNCHTHKLGFLKALLQLNKVNLVY